MPKTLTITPDLHAYVCAKGVREHAQLRRCREETLELGRAAGMQIAPEQGAFLALLVGAIGARRTLEIGTFTGYSTLAVALALPPEGRIDACDISEDYVARARRYWADAGVSDKILTHIAPAMETLDRLLVGPGPGSYDFAFIDADKTGYDGYLERCLKLVRTGGIIAIDNVLWSGAVIDPHANDTDTLAIRALNEKLANDPRVDIALTTIADGLFLLRKR